VGTLFAFVLPLLATLQLFAPANINLFPAHSDIVDFLSCLRSFHSPLHHCPNQRSNPWCPPNPPNPLSAFPLSFLFRFRVFLCGPAFRPSFFFYRSFLSPNHCHCLGRFAYSSVFFLKNSPWEPSAQPDSPLSPLGLSFEPGFSKFYCPHFFLFFLAHCNDFFPVGQRHHWPWFPTRFSPPTSPGIL